MRGRHGIAWLALAVAIAACGGDDDSSSTSHSPAEAGVAPGAELTLGASCTDSSQCASRLCVEVAASRAVCSKPCASSAECPAGTNWRCNAVPDQATQLCACASDSALEVCGDGRDNDCNGVSDCALSDAGAMPDSGAVPGTDAAVGGGADAGCGELACDAGAPVATCETDPGLCSLCSADSDCDDHVACTEDHCRARGCVHTPNSSACADDQVCDLRARGCKPAHACTSDVDCEDDDACTRGEHCDTATKVCRFVLIDGDGDEHPPSVCGGDDCDDDNPLTYPGALDVCDGEDNDCDGTVDPPSAALLCASDRSCSEGVCSCREGLTTCHGGCFSAADLASDDANCGACDKVCGGGTSCVKSACKDVDECKTSDDLCGDNGTCHNIPGAYECVCDDGYAGSNCVDVDECNALNDTCDRDPDACHNDDGDFHCECPSGYGGSGIGDDGCSDEDECSLGSDDCSVDTVCFNVSGGFGCVRGASAVAASIAHSCALLEDGRIKCWGDNAYGELGLGDTFNRGSSSTPLGDNLPAVDLGTGRSARAIAVGGYHTCALLDNGAVKCWGANASGGLGQGNTTTRGDQANEMGDNLAPVALGTGRTAKAIALGWWFSCALLDDNSVKCWGENTDGALGQGDNMPHGDEPGELGDALDPIDLGAGRSAKAIAAGDAHVCAILDNASVKCWGSNNYGQLGLGDGNARGYQAGQMGDTLQAVNLGAGRTAKALAAGFVNTCAVLDDDSLKCWGDNTFGQLGLGDGAPRGNAGGQMGDALPHVALGTGRTAGAVAVGMHTCAVLDDDSVKCWGDNAAGPLGLGDNITRGDNANEMGAQLPVVDLGTGRGATRVSVGESHSCALLDDATLRCWGGNGSGQLGAGTNQNIGASPGQMGDALLPIDLGRQ